MVISHNIAAMNSRRQAGVVGKVAAKSSEKLSSGYQINRAADNAAGLSISEKMRKQIRGLTRGVQNTEDGVSLCQVADGALAEVHDMLQRLNELAVKSANGTNSDSDRKYINDEVSQMLDEIDRIGNTTKFNDIYIFQGTEKKTAEKWITVGGIDTVTGKPQAIPIPSPSFDQIDMNCELVAGPFNSSHNGSHLQLAARSTKADMPATWNLIYNSGSTSYPKLVGEYTHANSSSVCAFVMDLRTIRPKPNSYKAEKDPNTNENTWSRIFEYKDAQGNPILELTQKVTMHEKNGNKEQYYTVSYTVENKTADCELKYSLVHHEDTAYNNHDFVESYHLPGRKPVEKSVMYDNNKTNANVSGTVPESLSIVNVDGALSFTESVLLDGGDGGTKADALIIGHYSAIGSLSYTAEGVTNTVSNVLGKAAMNPKDHFDLGFSLIWSGQALAAGATSDQYSFRQGIVNVDLDKNIPSNVIKLPEIEVTTINSMSVLTKKEYLDKEYRLWIQSGCDPDSGLRMKWSAMNTAILGIDDISLLTVEGAYDTLDRVSDALSHVSALRSLFGAYQNRLEHTIMNEENVVENTTAAESAIRDTDMADEMVRFSNNQVLLQAGQSILAQANQANQGVLSLLQ